MANYRLTGKHKKISYFGDLRYVWETEAIQDFVVSIKQSNGITSNGYIVGAGVKGPWIEKPSMVNNIDNAVLMGGSVTNPNNSVLLGNVVIKDGAFLTDCLIVDSTIENSILNNCVLINSLVINSGGDSSVHNTILFDSVIKNAPVFGNMFMVSSDNDKAASFSGMSIFNSHANMKHALDALKIKSDILKQQFDILKEINS